MGVLHYLFKMCFALLQLLGCMCLTVHLDQAHVEDTPGQTQTRVRKWCVCVCVCVCACVCVCVCVCVWGGGCTPLSRFLSLSLLLIFLSHASECKQLTSWSCLAAGERLGTAE